MSLKDLMKLLRKIKALHPEAADAEVWAGEGKCQAHISYVGYDRRHKPARIKLEE